MVDPENIEPDNPHDVEARWRERALRAKRDRGEPLDPDAQEYLRKVDERREREAREGARGG